MIQNEFPFDRRKNRKSASKARPVRSRGVGDGRHYVCAYSVPVMVMSKLKFTIPVTFCQTVSVNAAATSDPLFRT